MRKGDIYIADLGSGAGSEQGGTRPVIIIQSDNINKFTKTVVVIPLTTNLKRVQIPGCVLLPQEEGGLIHNSVALCYQIRVLSMSRLQNKIGTLSPSDINKIENGIKLTFDMS